MTLKNNLRQYIDAGYPIIYVDTYEEIKTDEIIESLNLGRTIIEWNAIDGLAEFKYKSPLLETKNTLAEALLFLNKSNNLDKHLIVIKDAHSYLNSSETELLAVLKRISQKIINGQIETTIIIVSSVISIPKEIEKFVTVFKMDDMTQDDIKVYIRRYLDAYNIIADENIINETASAFRGLSSYETDTLLNLSLAENGDFTSKNLKLIFEQKKQIIMRSDVIEMVDITEQMDDIGGMSALKKWLTQKSAIIKSLDSALEYGVSMPKGLMITGIPGCGKSLVVKAAAQLFEIPVLKLDMGKIMWKSFVESEANMREAIRLAESVSPCILWVDELEKGFAGFEGAEHEVTMRLFATFIKWLQDKKSSVFVMATADDVSRLPSELLRRGKFDDVFYIDLPDETERKSIFEIYLKKRRPDDSKEIDFEVLAGKTDGFSGADIENVISQAIETAFAERKEALTTEDIVNSIETFMPVTKIMHDKVKSFQEFYKMNSYFKNAAE